MANEETSIPLSAAYYIRSCINRTLWQMEDELATFEKIIINPEEQEVVKYQIQQLKIHHTQWIAEARKQFNKLPLIMRPCQDEVL